MEVFSSAWKKKTLYQSFRSEEIRVLTYGRESHTQNRESTGLDRECTVLYWTITWPAEGNKAGSIGRTDGRPVS